MKWDYLLFIDKETEAQKVQESCLKPNSWYVQEVGLELIASNLRTQTLNQQILDARFKQPCGAALRGRPKWSKVFPKKGKNQLWFLNILNKSI